jgi:hypothetical protein
MKRALRGLLLVVSLAVASCGGGSAPDSADAVERYLQAKVDRNETVLRSLLCSEMENVVDRELHTFDSVTGVEIENMQCTASGDGTTVSCTGVIKADYGTEQTDFPLTAYRAVNEDGEWKWCGEA